MKMSLTNINDLKALLQKHHLWTKKHLGQHFLINKQVLKKIIEVSEISPNDLIVEVGPGLGVLTEELAKKAGKVITIEKDQRLAALLKETLKSFPNIDFINADALKIPPSNISYKLIANIPYQITSPLLAHFLLPKQGKRPELIVILIQKEVAEKICAKPPHLNLLAILVQTFGKPKIIQTVAAGDFFPPPKVTSVILKIEIFKKPAVNCNLEQFFKIVRAGFGQKRKTLLNSLSHNLKLPSETIKQALQNCHIDPSLRAETLTLSEWEKISNVSNPTSMSP